MQCYRLRGGPAIQIRGRAARVFRCGTTHHPMWKLRGAKLNQVREILSSTPWGPLDTGQSPGLGYGWGEQQ